MTAARAAVLRRPLRPRFSALRASVGAGRMPSAAAATAILAAAAILERLGQRQAGLLYPDGYQYLLMARGITQHLRPVTTLGPRGDLFVPSLDAAVKPLYPALVAVVQVLGATPRAAAGVIAALGAAAAVVLATRLAWSLTASRLGALITAAAMMLSPSLAFWWGFAGPDPLAVSLALGTVLAARSRRATTTGVLAALAVAARPELVVPLGAAGLAAACSSPWRPVAGRAGIAWMFALAAVIGVVRPPLGVPSGAALAIPAVVAGAVLLGLLWRIGVSRAASASVCAGGLAVTAAAGLSGRAPGLAQLAAHGWPLLLAAAVGLLLACWTGRGREALTLMGFLALPAVAYLQRNPSSERYMTMLLPGCAIAAAFLVANPSPRRWVARGAAAVLLALLAVAVPAEAPAGPDAFVALAGELHRLPAGALLTAAPDAYGQLIPDRSVRSLATGRRGLILLDGAARAYASGLTARGRVIARYPVPDGFRRPDGSVDYAPAVLVRGTVVSRR